MVHDAALLCAEPSSAQDHEVVLKSFSTSEHAALSNQQSEVAKLPVLPPCQPEKDITTLQLWLSTHADPPTHTDLAAALSGGADDCCLTAPVGASKNLSSQTSFAAAGAGEAFIRADGTSSKVNVIRSALRSFVPPSLLKTATIHGTQHQGIASTRSCTGKQPGNTQCGTQSNAVTKCASAASTPRKTSCRLDVTPAPAGRAAAAESLSSRQSHVASAHHGDIKSTVAQLQADSSCTGARSWGKQARATSVTAGKCYGAWFLPKQQWGLVPLMNRGSTWSRQSQHLELVEQQQQLARQLGFTTDDACPGSAPSSLSSTPRKHGAPAAVLPPWEAVSDPGLPSSTATCAQALIQPSSTSASAVEVRSDHGAGAGWGRLRAAPAGVMGISLQQLHRAGHGPAPGDTCSASAGTSCMQAAAAAQVLSVADLSVEAGEVESQHNNRLDKDLLDDPPSSSLLEESWRLSDSGEYLQCAAAKLAHSRQECSAAGTPRCGVSASGSDDMLLTRCAAAQLGNSSSKDNINQSINVTSEPSANVTKPKRQGNIQQQQDCRVTRLSTSSLASLLDADSQLCSGHHSCSAHQTHSCRQVQVSHCSGGSSQRVWLGVGLSSGIDEDEQAAAAIAEQEYVLKLHASAAEQARLHGQLKDTFVLKAYKDFLNSQGLRQPVSLKRLPTPSEHDIEARKQQQKAQQARQQQLLLQRKQLAQGLCSNRTHHQGGHRHHNQPGRQRHGGHLMDPFCSACDCGNDPVDLDSTALDGGTAYTSTQQQQQNTAAEQQQLGACHDPEALQPRHVGTVSSSPHHKHGRPATNAGRVDTAWSASTFHASNITSSDSPRTSQLTNAAQPALPTFSCCGRQQIKPQAVPLLDLTHVQQRLDLRHDVQDSCHTGLDSHDWKLLRALLTGGRASAAAAAAAAATNGHSNAGCQTGRCQLPAARPPAAAAHSSTGVLTVRYTSRKPADWFILQPTIARDVSNPLQPPGGYPTQVGRTSPNSSSLRLTGSTPGFNLDSGAATCSTTLPVGCSSVNGWRSAASILVPAADGSAPAASTGSCKQQPMLPLCKDASLSCAAGSAAGTLEPVEDTGSADLHVGARVLRSQLTATEPLCVGLEALRPASAEAKMSVPLISARASGSHAGVRCARGMLAHEDLCGSVTCTLSYSLTRHVRHRPGGCSSVPARL